MERGVGGGGRHSLVKASEVLRFLNVNGELGKWACFMFSMDTLVHRETSRYQIQ